MPARPDEPRWLLLIHQIPPHPAYFRAKVGRRLARLGAVAIKNAVYVLPLDEDRRRDFQTLAAEIAEEGGEATVCAADLLDGLSNAQVVALFQSARESDYADIARETREIAKKGRRGRSGADDRAHEIAKYKKRLSDLLAIDFFHAPGREAAEASIAAAERRLGSAHPDVSTHRPLEPARLSDFRGKVWVTRKNIHVDRIACAWLVQRFVDPEARFAFVSPRGYRRRKGEVSFDMLDADFAHVGDRCSFETMMERFGFREPGLRAIAEIVHELDIRDGKFERAEASGVAAILAGIALCYADDDLERVSAGRVMFDALLELYNRKRS